MDPVINNLDLYFRIQLGAIRLIPKFCDSVLLIIKNCYGFMILLQNS